MANTPSKREPRPAAKPRRPVPYRSPTFDYALDFRAIDFREHPELYRVGRGEEGVLLVEPYKGEILPHWRFATPAAARKSAAAISKLFRGYKRRSDFVGMDMARKYLQMGFTRARRYANHRSGRKYGPDGKVLPFTEDPVKAEAAAIFYAAWKKVEADPVYAKRKAAHRTRYG